MARFVEMSFAEFAKTYIKRLFGWCCYVWCTEWEILSFGTVNVFLKSVYYKYEVLQWAWIEVKLTKNHIKFCIKLMAPYKI